MKHSPTGQYVSSVTAGEPVDAFVPDALPPRLAAPDLEPIAEPLRHAEAALERLDVAGAMIPSIEWFIYAFVRKEALLSSEIEGTQATLADVLSWEHTARSLGSDPDDIEEVTNYVAAVDHAFTSIHDPGGAPISVRLLDECHRILMQGVRGANKQPGAIRRTQNWIGGARPGNAAFVPPPPDRVGALLGDLERYIHSASDLPPLIRVALVHVQFETIHPYLDGNGRLGRLLIALLLAHWGLFSRPLLYLSLYLKAHQSEYYDRLGAVRTEGDWVGWTRFFLDGVADVADDAVARAGALHERISADRRRLLASSNITVAALQLFEQLPGHPVVTMPLVTRMIETTKPTAGKAIGRLVDAGVLEEVGARKRDRAYRYAGYLDVLG
jgi:Fic family protein